MLHPIFQNVHSFCREMPFALTQGRHKPAISRNKGNREKTRLLLHGVCVGEWGLTAGDSCACGEISGTIHRKKQNSYPNKKNKIQFSHPNRSNNFISPNRMWNRKFKKKSWSVGSINIDCAWKRRCDKCVCERWCVKDGGWQVVSVNNCVWKIVCPREKGLWKILWEVKLWCVCGVRKWGVGSRLVMSEFWNRGCNELVWWGSDEWEVSGEWDVLSGGWAVGMVSGKWWVACDEWWAYC